MSLRSFTDPSLDYDDFLIDVLVDIKHPLLILRSDAEVKGCLKIGIFVGRQVGFTW